MDMNITQMDNRTKGSEQSTSEKIIKVHIHSLVEMTTAQKNS